MSVSRAYCAELERIAGASESRAEQLRVIAALRPLLTYRTGVKDLADRNDDYVRGVYDALMSGAREFQIAIDKARQTPSAIV